ncbi:MAG TPA: hypothetical protein VM388_09590, partial [Acidimicrobiales bacterium]|nr:hypothetical protein [Acidimicrobiales bacterium]
SPARSRTGGQRPPPAPAPPVTRQPPAAAAAHRSSNGLGWAVGIVAVLVIGLLAFTLGNRDSGDPSDTASDDTPATTTAGGSTASTASTAGGGGGDRTATTARGTATSAPAAATGDRVPYTDPQTGFTISYPRGWTVRTDGTLTDFRDPDTGAYLRVDHIEPPGPSPEGAWFELEKSFAAENANYQRIRIEPTTYNGYRAAIWEFTYTSGAAQLHVVDLGFITPRYGFALYFQTRAGDWDRMQPTFQAFKDSFQVPS